MEDNSEKYLIVHLLTGEAEVYHRKMISHISGRFGVKNITHKISPHVTLKHFDKNLSSEEAVELIGALQEFCSLPRRASYILGGIGHFDGKTIFTEVKPSLEMKELYLDLVKKLSIFPWANWSSYERENIHFHSSLVHEDAKEKFDAIYNFALERDRKFDMPLDKITLVKKSGLVWNVCLNFPISKL